jgi:DNA polymerase-4
MGPKLLQTAAITGIREIGEIAALSIIEATAIFGKQGLLLRNMAQGIDGSRVEEKSAERRIKQQADFNEDIVDLLAVRGALETLIEHGGLKMRNEKLGMRTLRLAVMFSDGVEIQGIEKTKRLLVTDSEIMTAAYSLFKKTVTRRLRIRSIGLCFEDLSVLGYQPDLFEPVTEMKDRLLQEAIDKIQNRFGAGAVKRGVVLAASRMNGGQKLLPGPSVYG